LRTVEACRAEYAAAAYAAAAAGYAAANAAAYAAYAAAAYADNAEYAQYWMQEAIAHINHAIELAEKQND
jgi:hypothetical protein